MVYIQACRAQPNCKTKGEYGGVMLFHKLHTPTLGVISCNDSQLTCKIFQGNPYWEEIKSLLAHTSDNIVIPCAEHILM